MGLALFAASSVHASVEHDQYSKLFPFHAEYCALTQIKPKGETAGGPGGHATLYVHGLCKDQNALYPKVIPCSKITDPYLRDHEGVGISVDNEFRNVNWVAVPGYDLFVSGGLSSNDHVNQAAMDEVVRQAIFKRVYEGVHYNDERVNPLQKGFEYQRQVAVKTIGTDLAIQFGRDMRCIRFPIPKKRLTDAANFLNKINERYVDVQPQNRKVKKETYHWSGLHNNCAQLSANILSTLGVRDPIPTELDFVRQLGNIGLPSNGLITLQNQFHNDVLSFSKVRGNSLFWNDLKELHYLPIGVGAISLRYPVIKENDFYDVKLWVVTIAPRQWFKTYRIISNSLEAFNDIHFTQLNSNLDYWYSKYRAELHELKSQSNTRDRMLYQAYIEQQIAHIDQLKQK